MSQDLKFGEQMMEQHGQLKLIKDLVIQIINQAEDYIYLMDIFMLVLKIDNLVGKYIEDKLMN